MASWLPWKTVAVKTSTVTKSRLLGVDMLWFLLWNGGVKGYLDIGTLISIKSLLYRASGYISQQ